MSSIIEQASTWHARLSADDVTSQDWQELDAWLQQDPGHREAFESIRRMSGALSMLGDEPMLQSLHDGTDLETGTGDAEVVTLRPDKARRTWNLRPRHMAFAASVLVALMVPFLYFMGSPKVPASTDYETAVAERTAVVLEDGSSLTLNADTRLTVTLTEDERRVALWRGELFLDVAAEPDRPFSVRIGDHQITVTGTSFDVRYRNNPARVTVHEGHVRVGAAVDDSGSGDALELQAGQQLILVTGATPIQLSDNELSKSSDWRNGWLHFEDSTLAEVIAELEPYLDKPIVLTSRKVGALKVGGSFNVDNLDSMWISLEALLPIQVIHETDRVLIRHESDTVSP